MDAQGEGCRVAEGLRLLGRRLAELERHLHHASLARDGHVACEPLQGRNFGRRQTTRFRVEHFRQLRLGALGLPLVAQIDLALKTQRSRGGSECSLTALVTVVSDEHQVLIGGEAQG